jgi:hypothetical protein
LISQLKSERIQSDTRTSSSVLIPKFVGRLMEDAEQGVGTDGKILAMLGASFILVSSW